MKVLVAYATRHGATRGIAERIAETLERRGHEVTTQPADQVPAATAMTRSSSAVPPTPVTG